ncbi:hypothetical protein [Ruminococcus flavefaciens]|uniref:hypothetical protein n=1 Tax=Ruminococcus flavefaciens TaxID=1265 RepID=UPI0026ED2391|nr:hypothetical protein [Ruminococcus flavefaciens]MDD7516995.1 hypothetical protein [Ruminococcus flavefaciens]MDY5692352.1 hypothetical protein [Ruminococcus flavefaciens]
MKIRELIRYTKRLLDGKRARTMMICILPIAAELFFRFAEAAAYCLLLYFGGYKPIVLFGGREPVQLVIAAVSTLFRWLTTAPLMYAAAMRLYSITAERNDLRHMAFSRILLRKCTFRRSISAMLWTKVIGLFALVPAIFFGTLAYMLLNGKLYAEEAFLAANAVFLALVSAVMWIMLKISFSAVPFLLVRFPKKTAFRTVIYSIGFMRGRKNVFMRLMAVYIPQMLTVAGLPYGLTKFMTAFSLGIDIFIREDEYLEADRADSRGGKTRNAGKLPRRQKRRFKASADKA